MVDLLRDLAVRVQVHQAARMLLARWDELAPSERQFDLREPLLDVRAGGLPELDRLEPKRRPTAGVPWWASQAG
jgi:hypothetical protein